MGIFDLFGSPSTREDAARRKLARRLTERYGPPENRQKAIDQLGRERTAGSLETLCLRFTIHSEPGITDQEEKELALGHLLEAGRDAIAPVTAFLQKHEAGVSWGLQALAGVATSEEVVAITVAELTRLATVYTRDPEKKLTLLAWLAEHHPGAASDALEPAVVALLEDFSDDVRIRATRLLALRAPSEPIRVALLELLVRDAGNARVRGEVLTALATHQADVAGYRPRVEPLIAEPWFLDREGRVKKRG